MAPAYAASFRYDLVDGADDQFLRDRPMVRIRDNDLPPVRRKPDDLRLYFVNPPLLGWLADSVIFIGFRRPKGLKGQMG